MIKGFLLKERPSMNKVSVVDILSDIDFLNKESDLKDLNDGSITKRSAYKGEKFITVIYEIDFKPRLDAIQNLYSLIQKAKPEFIKVFKLGENTIVASYNHFKDKDTLITFYILIEELLRVGGFILKNENNVENSAKILKDYIDIYVNYPGSINNNSITLNY